MAQATAWRSRSRLRFRDALLVVPAFLAGVLLLAVCVADRTGAPIGDVLQPRSVSDLVPAGLTTDNPGR